MMHLKLSFARTAQAKRSKLFLLALALCVFGPFTGIAQKIEANKVWSTLKKAPVMKLKPEFNTYSVEYDFGTLPVQAKETPELQDLKFQESGGDLNLKISFNKLFIVSKNQQTNAPKVTPKPGAKPQKPETPAEPPKFYSIVNYMAHYGYDLIDKKSGTTLYAFNKKNDSYTTPTFNSVTELDAYLKNSLENDLLAHTLTKINKRIKYDFSAQNYDVRVTTANSITGPSPAYTEINKASTDFAGLVSEKTPTKEAVQPQIAVWEKHLANADWKGRGAINKKVANALIENLCAAYMLTGDFGKLREKVDLFEKNNPGAPGSASALTFEADPNFPGSNPALQTIKKNDKMQNYIQSNYHEFSYDLIGD